MIFIVLDAEVALVEIQRRIVVAASVSIWFALVGNAADDSPVY